MTLSENIDFTRTQTLYYPVIMPTKDVLVGKGHLSHVTIHPSKTTEEQPAIIYTIKEVYPGFGVCIEGELQKDGQIKMIQTFAPHIETHLFTNQTDAEKEAEHIKNL